MEVPDEHFLSLPVPAQAAQTAAQQAGRSPASPSETTSSREAAAPARQADAASASPEALIQRRAADSFGGALLF